MFSEALGCILNAAWIWRIRIYPRQPIFIKTGLGHVPTGSISKNRSVPLPIGCLWCKHEKIVDHVLFYYSRAVQI